MVLIQNSKRLRFLLHSKKLPPTLYPVIFFFYIFFFAFQLIEQCKLMKCDVQTSLELGMKLTFHFWYKTLLPSLRRYPPQWHLQIRNFVRNNHYSEIEVLHLWLAFHPMRRRRTYFFLEWQYQDMCLKFLKKIYLLSWLLVYGFDIPEKPMHAFLILLQ